jgi:hypothetical protein
MGLILFLDLKKGSTGPRCLRDVLELEGCSCLEEFANCALGQLANLK